MALEAAQRPPVNAAPSGARLMAMALAAGICAVLLIFLVFAAYQDVAQREIRRAEIDKYLRTISNSTAWGIDNWLAGRLTLAEDVAREIENSPPAVDPSVYLSSPVYARTFLWTYYGAADGGYYSAPWDDTIPNDYDPRSRPWYKDAVDAGMPTLTEPYLDINTHIETITAAVPVRSDGRVVGVVGADFSTDSLAEKLKETDLGGLGFA
ncbi:MAG TPA: cache domain-containing protein, partial [Parvularculaceae bacterium]|nr:cache domain-containing protein [Parvularculaceae bacterium]